MKIALTSIPVHDPLAAFKFYTEVLGFVEKLFMPEMRVAIVASPEEPNGTGLLLEPNDNQLSRTYQQGLYAREIPVIVFGVADIQQEFEKLKNAGIIFRREPVKTDAGTQALFEDTCGNLVQLYQP
jgi:predicted enzyme related to lactoylglutathione lyase